MKTTRIFAALMPLLMFSCAKENIVPEDNNTKPSEEIKTDGGEKYQFAVTLSPETGSKAAFDDSKGVIWVAGGKAALISENKKNIASEELSTISEDKYSATFKFEAEAGKYRLCYPYNEKSYYNFHLVEVPSVQTQAAAGISADTFAAVADNDIDLTAENLSVSDLTYHVVGSYLRFVIYSDQAEPDETIQSVKIYAQSPVAGKYRAHFDYSTTIEDRYPDNSIEVVLSEACPVTTSADGAKGIYAAVLKGEYTGLTYRVKTNKAEYEFNSTRTKTINNGEISDVKLNLSNAKVIKYNPDQKLYLVGTACWAGWSKENAIEMQRTTGQKYEVTTFLRTGKTLWNNKEEDRTFKFLGTRDYWKPVYVNAGDNETLKYMEDYPSDAEDVKFRAPHDGLYKITADLKTMKVKLELCPLYLVSHFTGWQFDSNPRLMEETGTAGEYKVSKVHINGDDNGFKFAFRKGANIDYDYYIVPKNEKKDCEIKFGTQWYNNGNAEIDVLSQTLEAETLHNQEGDCRWTVKQSYNNKYYDITLNLETMKMTIKLSQGNTFYLVGINGEWSDRTSLKAVADENGIAKWENITASEGTFKICGENTIDKWWGEWYFAQLPVNGTGWYWKSDTYGTKQTVLIEKQENEDSSLTDEQKSGDKKWLLTESGNYTFTFDSRSLKLTVVKNN